MFLVSGDGIEADASEVGLFGTELAELFVHTQFGFTSGGYGLFQPTEELHEGNPVLFHRFAESGLFGFVLHGFHQCHGRGDDDGVGISGGQVVEGFVGQRRYLQNALMFFLERLDVFGQSRVRFDFHLMSLQVSADFIGNLVF